MSFSRSYIKLYTGKLLGYIDEDSNGNKIVYDFSGKIVSRYSKSTNITTDLHGRNIAFGDISSAFLFSIKI